MFDKLKRYLWRRKTPIIFNDPQRTAPVSSAMGTDRGTPIDRYYIEEFLRQNRTVITGTVLEIAESTYTRKFGHGIMAYEVLHVTSENQAATIIGDLAMPENLPENCIDCFICTQTFNFIFDVAAAMNGAHKLLKPGGALLGTVSGLSQVSRFDMERWGDYWRFADMSIRRLLNNAGFEKISVITYGNVLAAKLFLDGVAVEDLFSVEMLHQNDHDYQMIIGFCARKK